MAEDKQASVFSLLQQLSIDEIHEVFEGFCDACLVRFESRVRDVTQKKLKESSPTSTVTKTPTNSVSWSSKVTPRASPLSVERNSSNGDTGSGMEFTLNDGLSLEIIGPEGMPDAQKERIRLSKVGRKKDFCHRERIDGRLINLVEGLELHTNVFNAEEQRKIVACVTSYQKLGQKNQLLARTYSEPRKWMRGKGRATIQFGCCYNYAADKNGNPPGILQEEEVDPMPPLLKNMIRRLVRWHILPPTCLPNSCIVNIYDDGDCIPPHIDHHDFVRPFCTVSFLTESNIVFGHNLKIVAPGEFSGPVSIPLPVGSVLILNGNGADVAKHCIPSVRGKRISITFPKMADDKLPHWYRPDRDLQGLKPLMSPVPAPRAPPTPSPPQPSHSPAALSNSSKNRTVSNNAGANLSKLSLDEFPALGGDNSSHRKHRKR
uniref:Fe2OG dioxygenase domain-containing protein n=1 Tax=Kalanchoe fedtschenkoi TaxID=63787 RepID=A0A7N0RG27_KALFE